MFIEPEMNAVFSVNLALLLFRKPVYEKFSL
jgi:hypothetical protein